MIALAILAGFLTTFTIRSTTNAAKLSATLRKIQADLLEFRLYFDEPRLVWNAQMNLVRDNLRLMLMFLPAVLILALPMTWLIVQLDVVYGLRPLHPGEATVFTAQFRGPLKPAKEYVLKSSGAVKVESAAIRMERDNQVCWSVRSWGKGRAYLDLSMNGNAVGKSVMTGDPPMILSPRRTSSLAEFLWHPEEPRLPEGEVLWLSIDYPKAETAVPWLVWFLVISTAAAWVAHLVF